jgi:hypothetical protein
MLEISQELMCCIEIGEKEEGCSIVTLGEAIWLPA